MNHTLLLICTQSIRLDDIPAISPLFMTSDNPQHSPCFQILIPPSILSQIHMNSLHFIHNYTAQAQRSLDMHRQASLSTFNQVVFLNSAQIHEAHSLRTHTHYGSWICLSVRVPSIFTEERVLHLLSVWIWISLMYGIVYRLRGILENCMQDCNANVHTELNRDLMVTMQTAYKSWFKNHCCMSKVMENTRF